MNKKASRVFSSFLFSLVFMSLSIGVSYAEGVYPLKSKLDAFLLHQKVVTQYFDQLSLSEFKKALSELPEAKKKEAQKLIQEFDSHLPEKVLMAFVKYRLIEESPEKLEDVLTFLMISKAMTLRDQADSNPKALEGLIKFTEHKKVTPVNLEELMLPLYREKSKFLAHMKDDALFFDALKASPLFYFDLKDYLSHEAIVSFDPLGKIPGNHYDLAGEVDLSELIRSAKKQVIIDSQFFLENKFHQEILNWVVKNSPKDFKFTLVTDHEENTSLKEALKKFQHEKIQTLALAKGKAARSSFHEHLHKMNFLLIDPLNEKGKLIHHNQVSQIMAGPIVGVFYGLLLNFAKEEGILSKLPESLPYVGEKSIKLSISSPDRTFTNLRSQLIQSIVQAKTSLLLDQLFLYDPLIVDALLKKKIKQPDIEIKAFVDMSPTYEMNGLPNTLFLKELAALGIGLRTKMTTSKNLFIIDENEILVGHPHLNPDTLDGHHFEVMFLVEDSGLSKGTAKDFQKQWRDPNTTYKLNLDQFRVRIDGSSLRKPSSQVVNDLGAKLLRNRKFILR